MNGLRVNYAFGGSYAVKEDFTSAAGTAAPGSLAVNIEGQPPPPSVTGFLFLTASGGTTKVRGIGFAPGPNGTVSGTNQPIVDKLANSNITDCSQVVNSAFNYTFGAEVPGFDDGIQRLSFPAIAGYQLIDTPVDIYSLTTRVNSFDPNSPVRRLEFFCLPIGYNRDQPAIFRSLNYTQLWETNNPPPATCSIEQKDTDVVPPRFFFEGTGPLRSVFVRLREVTFNTPLEPQPGRFFFCFIKLFERSL